MEVADILCAAIIVAVILFLPRLFGDKCPECKGRMIEETYDTSLGKTVYRCTECGRLFVIL